MRWLYLSLISLLIVGIGVDIWLRMNPRVETKIQFIERYAEKPVTPIESPKGLFKNPETTVKTTTRILKEGTRSVVVLPPVVKTQSGKVISAPSENDLKLAREATESTLIQEEIQLPFDPHVPSRWSGVLAITPQGVDIGLGFDLLSLETPLTDLNLTLMALTTHAGLGLNANLTPSVAMGVAATKPYQAGGAGISLTASRRW